MANIFRDLTDEAYFQEYVGKYYESLPSALSDLLDFEITVDGALIQYAYDAYMQGVRKFSLILLSGDPDHHKRAGALLHALYLSKPISDFKFSEDLNARDTLCTPIGVNYAEAERELGFARLYSEYHNEMTAFDLALGACFQYGDWKPEITLDYAHSVCKYLKDNRNLSVESLFILFKSLMQR